MNKKIFVMQISAIVVITNNCCIGKDVFDSPVSWASKEDQSFYLGKIVKEKPMGIMGINTYDEVRRNANKHSIYSKLNVVILDDKIDYKEKKFILNDDNEKHLFTKIDHNSIVDDMKFYSQHFKNNNIFILGGNAIYSMFLSHCDVFWITVEKNVSFENGIKLFPNCDNIDDIIRLMNTNNLHLTNKETPSDQTSIYEFRKKTTI